MGLFSWIKSLGISDKKQEQVIELSEEQKDIKQMEKELEHLKSRKFRIERVEYKENNSIFYYAQVYIKIKYDPYNAAYVKEYYDNEWWRLCTGRGGNVFVNNFLGGGAARMNEQDALQLIEDFKTQSEDEIRRTPERKKQLMEYEKIKAERQKKLEAEYKKKKPIITHKNI